MREGGSSMSTIEKQIEIDLPTTTVYNQWTQFEEFPKFMEGVQEVQQLQDDRLFWRAEVAGVEKEWYATIAKQIPDQIVSWRSEVGVDAGGMVTFRPLGGDRTEVTLSVSYEPEDLAESVGDMLGFLSRRVEGDLKRFKEFIEARGTETGAWRGTISHVS
jgi:uncharacterized membrane protein